jgi:gliding motility-associated-like protein
MKKLFLIILSILSIASQSFAQNVPSYVPTNGLVAWWPFSGNAIDSSGNGNNGTVNGATLTTDRFGNANKAYNFNGLTNIIEVSANTMPVFQRTVSIWFYSTNIGIGNAGRGLFGYGGSNCGQSWNMHLDNAGSVNGQNSYEINTHCNLVSITSSYGNNTPIGSWHNWVVTSDGNGTYFYIDGIQISYSSLFTNNTYVLNKSLIIGCYPNVNGVGASLNDANNTPWNGKIDDIGIWNRALTPCEVQALYTGLPSTFNTNLITQDTIKACGDSVLVAATSGLNSYSWNTGATSASVFAKNTGWYKVTGGNTSDCTATDSVFVSILKANILNNDTTVCLGASLTLNAQQAPSGTSCTKSGLATNLQNGLVGYWPFCGNANDMSGSNNHGTVIGASLTSDRFGNANSAYSFNGVNNVINIPTNNLSIPNFLSISTWIYKSNLSNDPAGIVGPATYLPTTGGYFLRVINGKGELSISSPYVGVQTNQNIIQNNWYYLVATYDNNKISLYINGQLDKTQIMGSGYLDSWTSSNNMTLGQEIDYASSSFLHPWNGKLDDIAIWNRALSASEVAQLYQTSSYATTYLWSTGATTASINVTPTQTTKYWLQVSNGIATCTDTVTITVQNPTAPAVSNVSYCQGATASVLTATASAGNSLMWYSTATGGTGSSTAPTPSTTTVGSTTYYVSQITPQGCESARATLTVTVNVLPQANITASKTPIICTGDSVIFSVNPQVAGQSYVWYKDGVIINGASSTSYAAKQSGAYSVKVTNNNGCSITSAASTLNVYPWPTVNAGPDKEVPAGTSVDIITQTTNAQSIAWSPITGLSCINCASPTATVNFPIVYIVTVTSAGGCSVSDTVAIQLVCEEDLLYMPNTFTPNGDGENDRFYPMGKGLGEVAVFRIVNRLGQVVYTRSRFAINNASYGWDGTFNGADLGMDVYSYYIEVPCATGQIIKKTGDISLLR